MKILTKFFAFCLLTFNLNAQCVERVNLNSCTPTLTYTDLSTTVLVPYTAFGEVAISRVGVGTIYTGTLPYAFPPTAVGQSFEVFISPNPTTGLVTLDIESAQAQTLDISVINRLGQVVLQKKMDAITKGYATLTLDLSNLPNDMYILRTFDGQTF